MSRRQAERKSNQERVRRNHLKEAIEVLHNTLLENDASFRQEALRRSSAEGLRATRTASSVLNATQHLSFTKVEIINQAIHSIRAAIAENERLRNEEEEDEDTELQIPSPPSSPLPEDSVQANKPETADLPGVGVATTGAPAVTSLEEESSHHHEHHHPRKTQPLDAIVNGAPEPEPSPADNVSNSLNQDMDQKIAAHSQRGHDHSATHSQLGALLQHPFIPSHNGPARSQDVFHVNHHQQRAERNLNLLNNISPTDAIFPVPSSTVVGYHNPVAQVALPYFEIERSIEGLPSQDPIHDSSQYASLTHNQQRAERENMQLPTSVSSADPCFPSSNSTVLGYHNPASTKAPVSLPHFEERKNGRPALVETFAIDLPSLVRKFAAQRAALAAAITPPTGAAEVLSRTQEDVTSAIWQSGEGRDTKRRKAE